MTLTDINKALSNLAEQPTRENILAFSFELLQWMNITPNADKKPQLLSPQTQKLKDYLANAPQTVQPQLYRLSADNQPIRVRFAVLKKLKKEYISQLVDNDPSLGSYQAMAKGLTMPATGTAFIPAQPYFVHFVTTPDYDKLVLIFNQGEQKRVVSFRNRLTNTQYLKIIQTWQGIGSKSKPEIADLLWKSLDIKEVNKEFYKQIKERFDALLGIVKTQHSTATENQVKQFTVRMIGRYIFCWFLKEKGIIPLSLISKQTIESTDKYYQTVLLKLFFETLNTKVQDRDPIKHNKLFEKIPYLNGGLFDESEEDKLFTELDLDAWLLPFVEILESYDFTVDESSSQYQQVAVDPEMLGRIFENLLASQNEETEKLANQRKAFGAFYTPREIVDYMVNESIKAFLQTQWEQHIEADKTKHLNNPEPIGDIFGNKKPQQLAIETKRYELKPEEKQKIEKTLEPLFADNPDAANLKKEEKNLLLNFLEKIKILDPACGSGAFPMGILHKLVELHEALGTVKSSYELKKDILSLNIYGVDIMPMAIEISRLRAWLSLVLEEDYKPTDPKHNFGVKPLPNLDFKFVCANGLVDSGYDEFLQKLELSHGVPTLIRLDGEILKLEKIRDDYFDTSGNHKKRDELREDFNSTKGYIKTEFHSLRKSWALENFLNKIDDWNPFDDSHASTFFSPSWMFGKAAKMGFDIVIGNPPYIGERKNKKHFLDVQNSPSSRYYFGRMDYFYFFYHLGLDFLKSSGHLSFITTNYFPTAMGGRKLRKDLKNRTTIKEIINFNEGKVFESAAGQHNMILLLQKVQSNFKCKVTVYKKDNLLENNEIISVLKKQNNSNSIFEVEQKDLWDGEENYLRLTGVDKSSSPINDILNKIKNNSTDLLGNIASPLIGLESSLDEVYVVYKPKVESVIEDEAELEYVKPFFKNSDVLRYQVKEDTDKCIFYLHEGIKDIKKLKGIYKYLLANKDDIQNRKGANLRGAYKRGHWWVLNTPRLDMNFNGDKIVTPYRTKTLRFAFTSEAWYASRDVYYIVKKKESTSLKYLLALLNSNLYYNWFYYRGKRKGDTLELYAKPLKEAPIKEVNQFIQNIFIDKVDKIIALKKNNHNTTSLEKEIDVLVYKLYELTYDEVKIIDKDFWLTNEEFAQTII